MPTDYLNFRCDSRNIPQKWVKPNYQSNLIHQKEFRRLMLPSTAEGQLLVRPILLYGVQRSWDNPQQILWRVSISGALRTTVEEDLQVFPHLPPIDLFGKEMTNILALRWKCLSIWKSENYDHMEISCDKDMITKTFERNFITTYLTVMIVKTL